MKKRLRKKLHRGEFQEFGFSVAWQFTPALDAPGCDLFFEALIGRVEAAGLSFGGGGGPEGGSGFLCLAKRGSASEKDRAQFAEWFRKLEIEVVVGPLEDAWHSPEPQIESVKAAIERDEQTLVLPSR